MTQHRNWIKPCTALLFSSLACGLLSCQFVQPGSVIAQPTLPAERTASSTPPSETMPAVDSRLVTANTRFGLKLFSQLWQTEGTKNLMISPSSIAFALSMVYNGAAAETQQAMAQTLELQGLNLEEINQANAALQTVLENADPSVKLAIANSLWGRDGFAFNPTFLEQNRQFYQAETTTLDFTRPEAVNRINQWVSQNTAGKIPTIVDQIDPTQVLFLINAVYFKGTWTTQFNPADTEERPFYRLDGTQKQHPLMTQRGNYLYAENDQFQAISLPYGEGRFSLDVFLPRSTSSMGEFQRSLTPEQWQTWLTQFRRREGTVQLPKFKSSYEASLNQSLSQLGMAVAFQPDQADFANLSDESTFINEVKHKTFIEVNEEGTEAAAVTSVGVAVASAPIDPPFQMVVDRPFFYGIRDQQTGTLLFVGVMVDP